MDWFGEYVYVPLWLIFVLLCLATGAGQYLLIGGVKLVLHWSRQRGTPAAPSAAPHLTIVSPGEFKREQQQHHS